MPLSSEISQALLPLREALSELGIRYYVGGSVASSAHGLPRSTLDVDLVMELKRLHIEPLVQHLEAEYYIDGEMIREALFFERSFNLIHLDTMIKVDIFVLKRDAFAQQAFLRAQSIELSLEPGQHPLHFASAEDIILQKLQWYVSGHRVSERQWLDILGVLKVQRDDLDLPYLSHWADYLNLKDLLLQAFQDAWEDSAH